MNKLAVFICFQLNEVCDWLSAGDVRGVCLHLPIRLVTSRLSNLIYLGCLYVYFLYKFEPMVKLRLNLITCILKNSPPPPHPAEEHCFGGEEPLT